MPLDRTQIDNDKLDALVHKAVAELSAGYGGVMIDIGKKLGLYEAMVGEGPLTSGEVADRAGCAERYVREWLNSQAAGGYVEFHPESSTYELTPEQAFVLADDTSPVHIPPAWEVVASLWADEGKALDAFRTGHGVPWGDHDHRLYCGVAAFFANAYRGSLVQDWLPALDGVTAKLEAGAKVADVGCGHGYSTVLMAEAYPNSRFVGFDAHEDSIDAARKVARAAGVEDRVRFETADASGLPEAGFDLVCFFDCLHDLGNPVDAARRARGALTDDGTVMLVEPYAGDRVEENLTPVGRLFYAASTTLCCAHAISEDGTHVLGAQAGAQRLGQIFSEAGFSRFRQAAETPFNIILEARP